MTTPDTGPDVGPATETPAGHPHPTASAVDAELAARCTSHADWLAGILAAAHADTLTRPDRLPADLYPHLPAGDVTAILARGIAIGMRAERLAARPRFHRDTLTRIQRDLATAGYTAMARLITRTLNTSTPSPGPGLGHPGPEHPADADQHHAREGHA